MKQLNRKQALDIYNSKVWEKWADEEIVKFQLYQDRLGVPFDRFHAALEKMLGRSVWTHELSSSNINNIRMEFEGIKQKPTFEEIMGLIPKEKLIMVMAPKQEQKEEDDKK